jgi:hypothetical protein
MHLYNKMHVGYKKKVDCKIDGLKQIMKKNHFQYHKV